MSRNRSNVFEDLENRRLMSVTTAPAYLVPTAPGVEVTPVLTAGDTASDYRMVGVPDGLGAFDNGDGTFTVLMDHELGPTQSGVHDHGAKGAFVSKWVIDKTTLNVLSGDDLIKSVFVYDVASGAYVPAVVAFNRFCSATLAEPSAFFNPATGKGTTERLFTNGEENPAGRAWAHVVSSGQSFELAALGNVAFENVAPNPFPQDLTLAGAQDDANRLFSSEGAGTIDPATGLPTAPPSEVYFYLGQKKDAGSAIDRAGLTGGVLTGLKVGAAANEAAVGSGDRFALANFGDVSSWDDKQLQAAAIANGVTQFRKPEDGSWDPNHPEVYRFVTSDAVGGNTRLWKLTFDDVRNPQAGGTVEIEYDSPASTPGEMFDNMTVNWNSDVLIQEDPGSGPYLSRVWQFDSSAGELTEIARHNPALFDPAYVGADKNFLTQDEESSGIIDLSKILGPGHYLADVQAHYPISAAAPHGFSNPDELVEGGQLLVINTNAPKATLSGGVLTVVGTVNDDPIAVTRHARDVTVSVGGSVLGTFSSKAIQSIHVSGYAGDDVLSVSRNVHPPVTFDGGGGNNTILERRGDDDVLDEGDGAE
jgi:hypothetical protein